MRLYIYAALALALLAGLGYVHHLQKKAAMVPELQQALKAERESTRKANEASNAYQADLHRLESERSNVPVVRLCKQTRKAPVSPAASGSDAAPTGHVSEAPAVDIGPDIGDQLLNYAIDAEANMLQLERLQGWVRDR